MKKTLLLILIVVSVLFVTSCSDIGTGTFPDWLIGSWYDSSEGETLRISSRKILHQGPGFSKEYQIYPGDTVDVYETKTIKEAKFTLKPYLRIDAKLNKQTGVLNIVDYDGVLGGWYTKL